MATGSVVCKESGESSELVPNESWFTKIWRESILMYVKIVQVNKWERTDKFPVKSSKQFMSMLCPQRGGT